MCFHPIHTPNLKKKQGVSQSQVAWLEAFTKEEDFENLIILMKQEKQNLCRGPLGSGTCNLAVARSSNVATDSWLMSLS